MLRIAGAAVSITGNEKVLAMLEGEVGHLTHVNEVTLVGRAALGLVAVEEHGNRMSDNLGNSLRLISLLAEQVVQTVNLTVSIAQLSVQVVDLSLAESLDGSHIGNFVPSALAKVEGTDMTYAAYVAAHSAEWTNIMTNLGFYWADASDARPEPDWDSLDWATLTQKAA